MRFREFLDEAGLTLNEYREMPLPEWIEVTELYLRDRISDKEERLKKLNEIALKYKKISNKKTIITLSGDIKGEG